MSNTRAPEDRLWTPANVVTVTRILLVPVFVAAMLAPWPDWLQDWDEAALWKPWISAFLFALLSCTDAVDGHLARSRGEVTNFGKFVDPLADKILVAAALLTLVELQILPSWVALVILIREFIVSGIRMVAASQGVVIAASWYGKAKTVFQIIAILLFIIKDSELLWSLHENVEPTLYVVSWIVMSIALVLTVLSMLDYFVKAAHLLGFKKKTADSAHETADTEQSDSSYSAQESLHASDGEISVEVLESNIIEKAQRVISLAQEQSTQLSTAESCTGGLIAGYLTSVSGSSSVVQGGVVSYSNDVKHNVLGVSQEDLDTVGAVSSEVAMEMCEGSRNLLKTDIAVSVTGIAGPSGGTPSKPVGTVWFGICSRKGTRSEVVRFEGNREQVRLQTVLHALSLFETELK